MARLRLDQALAERRLVASRSQAESYIKLGNVRLNGQVVTKPSCLVAATDKLEVTAADQYVSRAALKLESVAKLLRLNFSGQVVLDVGSSTGGFTDYALRHGARKVIAVEVGTDQLHPSLRGNPLIELHEQTDIRSIKELSDIPDTVVADVSFISLREILPAVAALCSRQTSIVVMVKPQFEAGQNSLKHKGVIKNDTMRREILKDFEAWAGQQFMILDKADSSVAGAKGNKERFYMLRKLA